MRLKFFPCQSRRQVQIICAIFAIAICAAILGACNSDNSAKHTLIITGAVHVYPTDTPPTAYPGTTFIDVLGPKDQVKIRDVEYKNGYMAVKVRLDDGREGWVFSGESIEVR